MSGDDQPFRILVVQPWTNDLKPIEVSLLAAGIDAMLTRVDFEAAINAALAHELFDAAIYDPTTPAMAREKLDACLKASGRNIPVIDLDDVTTIGARLLPFFQTTRN